jgi:hypothetical protein
MNPSRCGSLGFRGECLVRLGLAKGVADSSGSMIGDLLGPDGHGDSNPASPEPGDEPAADAAGNAVIPSGRGPQHLHGKLPHDRHIVSSQLHDGLSALHALGR